jgi:membrane AbrB-like protein
LVSLSGAFAALLWWLHAPAALMLGPLLASALVTANGGKVRLPARPFVLAQGIIGCMIARSVPASIAGDILAHWFLFTVGVFAVVAISSLLGWMMTHLQVLPGTTALWGTSPGAASVMTIMAEEYGADIRLVAFMQYLRVVIVAGAAALVARLFGVATGHASAETVWFPHIAWLSFAETMALAIGGPLIARALRIPAGAMLVPMVLGAVLVHFGWLAIELPPWLLAGCYALIGWNVGLRFTRGLLVHAARALPGILAGVLAMIVLCGAVAGMLVLFAGVDPLTAYLATSPGGADSVAIIAASTNVDLSFVMAMQTVRLFAVLFLAPVITRFIATRAYDA